MIKKIILIVAPALCILLCLYFSIHAWLSYKDNYIKVPVASHQLYQRICLKEEDLEEIDVPKAFLSNDVYLSKEDIIGKYVKLSYSLAKGSLIYKGALEEDIRDLSLTLLKQGEASYDLYAGEVKFNAATLAVNTNADIYLSLKTSEKAYSDLLIEDCRVIGLFDSQGKPIRYYDSDSRIGIVSIALGKEHVNILNKALMIGTLSLVSDNGSYDDNKTVRLNEDAEVLDLLR